jgi:hypothetical protein
MIQRAILIGLAGLYPDLGQSSSTNVGTQESAMGFAALRLRCVTCDVPMHREVNYQAAPAQRFQCPKCLTTVDISDSSEEETRDLAVERIRTPPGSPNNPK